MDRLSTFREAHFGLFVHWGSYTMRGFEAWWPLVREDISWKTFEDFSNEFDPQRYDPVE